MNPQRHTLPSALVLILAMLLAVVPSLRAQESSIPVKYKMDYIYRNSLYQDGNQLTLLTLRLEWPAFLAGSQAPALQRHLCSLLFGNEETSAAAGLAHYIRALGSEVSSIPDGDNVRRQYVRIILQQMGGEEGRYMSFCTLRTLRRDNSSQPEERQMTMFTYDILNDKVLNPRDLLLSAVFPDQMQNYDFVKALFHAGNLYEEQWEGLLDLIGTLPQQACLLPQGLVVSIPHTGTGEGFDNLMLMPIQKARPFLKRAAKKLLEKATEKTKEKGEVAVSQPVTFPGAEVDTTLVYDVVDEMPEYPGGMAAIADLLSRDVDYPDYEQSFGIQGRVVVAFVVERDGTVSSASVVSPVSANLDREAVNAVLAMPRWKPGRHHGTAVRTRMNVPVTFKLGTPKKS